MDFLCSFGQTYRDRIGTDGLFMDWLKVNQFGKAGQRKEK